MDRESSSFYRGRSTYGGVWKWRGAGISGERAAQQAEGIEVPPSRTPVDSGNQGEHGKAQRRPGGINLTSGRGVGARSFGFTKLIWML